MTRDYAVTVAPSPDGGPPQLGPREAVERWLDKLRMDKADSTVSDYHYRLKHFIEWCEAEGITRVDELNGWRFESYETHRRRQDVTTVTLSNELGTLKLLFEYLARVEVVDEDLPEKIDVPDVSKTANVDTTRLHETDAKRLLQFYRDDPEHQYSRNHALLEVAWYTGARLGALRGLDLRDILTDDQAVQFRHRPDRGTPLKNGVDGQRIVGLPDTPWEILQGYLTHQRHNVAADDGTKPVFASQVGRPGRNTVRTWMYIATEPCLYQACPHGNERATCEFTEYNHASKCPSSRSPHQVRTGSVTWQLNQGLPLDVVAERVNTSVRVLKQHYDVEGEMRRLRERRQQYLTDLGLNTEDST